LTVSFLGAFQKMKLALQVCEYDKVYCAKMNDWCDLKIIHRCALATWGHPLIQVALVIVAAGKVSWCLTWLQMEPLMTDMIHYRTLF
jgi:hypothetical protein